MTNTTNSLSPEWIQVEFPEYGLPKYGRLLSDLADGASDTQSGDQFISGGGEAAHQATLAAVAQLTNIKSGTTLLSLSLIFTHYWMANLAPRGIMGTSAMVTSSLYQRGDELMDGL